MKVNKDVYANWWYCDNIICNTGMVGLLHLGFPRVFILMRDYDTAYFAGYEDWKEQLVEVNFLDPEDREGADLDDLLTDAWNFLALTEREEERLAGDDEYNNYF